jgi:hypothetical protein
MVAGEPRARRRGFFLHSDTVGDDHGDHEAPEGVVVRIRIRGRSADTSRHLGGQTRGSAGTRISSGRSHSTSRAHSNSLPEIRSGSVTGSRQRAHSLR